MLIKDVAAVLKGEVICCQDNLEREVSTACASDMMSDVLAFVKDQAVLLTGLCNPQVVRTAAMMDMVCIVLVRGKRPDDAMVKLAKENGIVILCVPHRMFLACGLLFEAGIKAES